MWFIRGSERIGNTRQVTVSKSSSEEISPALRIGRQRGPVANPAM